MCSGVRSPCVRVRSVQLTPADMHVCMGHVMHGRRVHPAYLTCRLAVLVKSGRPTQADRQFWVLVEKSDADLRNVSELLRPECDLACRPLQNDMPTYGVAKVGLWPTDMEANSVP